MKRFVASILLLIYFTVSTGFVVSVHYCMNKLNAVELGDGSGEECDKCGMIIEESDGCCKSDVKMVKMQLDQAFAKITAPDFSLALSTSFTNDYGLESSIKLVQEEYPVSHGPPLSKQDIYLQNCVFRL